MTSPALSAGLRDQVLARLGLSTPLRPDLEGLGALYLAWGRSIPFDNLRKMIALRAGHGGPLPGGDAQEFLECWMADGTGGTCWAMSNALCQLVRSLGFDVQRNVGNMLDLGIANHASARVRIDGRSWLIDSLLHERPLPLDQGAFLQADPVFFAEVEPMEDGNHILWLHSAASSSYLPCRLLAGESSHAAYLAGYEASRESSPFNQRLYVRRNRPGEVLLLVGNIRMSKTAAGIASRELSPQEVLRSLREEFGISERVIDEWVRCGGLEVSFEPPSDPKPPPPAAKPPSQRREGELAAKPVGPAARPE